MNLYDAYSQAIAFSTKELQQDFLHSLQQQSREIAEKLRLLLTAAEQAGERTLNVQKQVAQVAHEYCQTDISANLVGIRLGVWQCDSLIALGGMSAVYKASRQDGQFAQQVAIKVLNPLIYPVTEHSKAFDEAGLCARLNHPAITTILDGGIVELQGQKAHYIVMEFVDGVSLSEWLAQNRPNLDTVLKLLIALCDALQYAHNHQVIHADLKPANILVDSAGRPRLIDFGISQLQHQTAAQSSDVSCYVRAMSVGFACPEQLNGEALSTQADIYSLGKILAVSLNQTKPSKLQHKELTAIICKATAAEPSQRYVSAHELQQDLLAILSNLPISAYKSSVSDRVRKLFIRQPWGTGFALSFAFGVLGFAVTVWHHNKKLEVERQIAEQTSSFMVDVFSAASPESYDNNPISAQDLLLIAKSKVDRFNSSPEIQQRLQLELASTFIGVGDYQTAVDLLEKIPNDSSIYVNKELLKASVLLDLSDLTAVQKILSQFNPDKLTVHSRLKYYLSSANIAHFQGKFSESLDLLERAEAAAQQIQQYSDLITINDYKMANYAALGQFQEQLQLANRSVELAKAHFGEESMQMVQALYSLQGALGNAEKFPESGEVLERLLAVQRKLYPADHPRLAITLNELGSNFTSMQNYQKAVDLHQQAINMIVGRFGKKHIDYVYGNAYLGNAYGFLQQHDKAIESYLLSYNASKDLLGPDNVTTLNALNNLARSYHEKGDNHTARQLLEQCLKLARTQFAEDSLRIAMYKSVYGSVLLALNEPDAARKNLTEALDVMKKNIGESHTRYKRTLEVFNKLPMTAVSENK